MGGTFFKKNYVIFCSSDVWFLFSKRAFSSNIGKGSFAVLSTGFRRIYKELVLHKKNLRDNKFYQLNPFYMRFFLLRSSFTLPMAHRFLSNKSRHLLKMRGKSFFSPGSGLINDNVIVNKNFTIPSMHSFFIKRRMHLLIKRAKKRHVRAFVRYTYFRYRRGLKYKVIGLKRRSPLLKQRVFGNLLAFYSLKREYFCNNTISFKSGLSKNKLVTHLSESLFFNKQCFFFRFTRLSFLFLRGFRYNALHGFFFKKNMNDKFIYFLKWFSLLKGRKCMKIRRRFFLYGLFLFVYNSSFFDKKLLHFLSKKIIKYSSMFSYVRLGTLRIKSLLNKLLYLNSALLVRGKQKTFNTLFLNEVSTTLEDGSQVYKKLYVTRDPKKELVASTENVVVKPKAVLNPSVIVSNFNYMHGTSFPLHYIKPYNLCFTREFDLKYKTNSLLTSKLIKLLNQNKFAFLHNRMFVKKRYIKKRRRRVVAYYKKRNFKKIKKTRFIFSVGSKFFIKNFFFFRSFLFKGSNIQNQFFFKKAFRKTKIMSFFETPLDYYINVKYYKNFFSFSKGNFVSSSTIVRHFNDKLISKTQRFYKNIFYKDRTSLTIYLALFRKGDLLTFTMDRLESMFQTYYHSFYGGSPILKNIWFGFFPLYPIILQEEMEVCLFWLGYGLDLVADRFFVLRLLSFSSLFKRERSFLSFITYFKPVELYRWLGDTMISLSQFYLFFKNVYSNYVVTDSRLVRRSRSMRLFTAYVKHQHDTIQQNSFVKDNTYSTSLTMQHLNMFEELDFFAYQQIHIKNLYMYKRKFDNLFIFRIFFVSQTRGVIGFINMLFDMFITGFLGKLSFNFVDYLDLFCQDGISKDMFYFFFLIFRWFRSNIKYYLEASSNIRLYLFYNLLRSLQCIGSIFVSWGLALQKMEYLLTDFYLLSLFDMHSFFNVDFLRLEEWWQLEFKEDYLFKLRDYGDVFDPIYHVDNKLRSIITNERSTELGLLNIEVENFNYENDLLRALGSFYPTVNMSSVVDEKIKYFAHDGWKFLPEVVDFDTADNLFDYSNFDNIDYVDYDETESLWYFGVHSDRFFSTIKDKKIYYIGDDQNFVYFDRNYQSVLCFYILTTHDLIMEYLRSDKISIFLKIRFFFLIRSSDFLKLTTSFFSFTFFFNILNFFFFSGVVFDSKIVSFLTVNTFMKVLTFLKFYLNFQFIFYKRLIMFFETESFADVQFMDSDLRDKIYFEDFIDLQEDSYFISELATELSTRPLDFTQFDEDNLDDAPVGLLTGQDEMAESSEEVVEDATHASNADTTLFDYDDSLYGGPSYIMYYLDIFVQVAENNDNLYNGYHRMQKLLRRKRRLYKFSLKFLKYRRFISFFRRRGVYTMRNFQWKPRFFNRAVDAYRWLLEKGKLTSVDAVSNDIEPRIYEFKPLDWDMLYNDKTLFDKKIEYMEEFGRRVSPTYELDKEDTEFYWTQRAKIVSRYNDHRKRKHRQMQSKIEIWSDVLSDYPYGGKNAMGSLAVAIDILYETAANPERFFKQPELFVREPIRLGALKQLRSTFMKLKQKEVFFYDIPIVRYANIVPLNFFKTYLRKFNATAVPYVFSDFFIKFKGKSILFSDYAKLKGLQPGSAIFLKEAKLFRFLVDMPNIINKDVDIYLTKLRAIFEDPELSYLKQAHAELIQKSLSIVNTSLSIVMNFKVMSVEEFDEALSSHVYFTTVYVGGSFRFFFLNFFKALKQIMVNYSIFGSLQPMAYTYYILGMQRESGYDDISSSISDTVLEDDLWFGRFFFRLYEAWLIHDVNGGYVDIYDYDDFFAEEQLYDLGYFSDTMVDTDELDLFYLNNIESVIFSVEKSLNKKLVYFLSSQNFALYSKKFFFRLGGNPGYISNDLASDDYNEYNLSLAPTMWFKDNYVKEAVNTYSRTTEADLGFLLSTEAVRDVKLFESLENQIQIPILNYELSEELIEERDQDYYGTGLDDFQEGVIFTEYQEEFDDLELDETSRLSRGVDDFRRKDRWSPAAIFPKGYRTPQRFYYDFGVSLPSADVINKLNNYKRFYFARPEKDIVYKSFTLVRKFGSRRRVRGFAQKLLLSKIDSSYSYILHENMPEMPGSVEIEEGLDKLDNEFIYDRALLNMIWIFSEFMRFGITRHYLPLLYVQTKHYFEDFSFNKSVSLYNGDLQEKRGIISFFTKRVEDDYYFNQRINYPSKFLTESKFSYYDRIAISGKETSAYLNYVTTTLDSRFSRTNEYSNKFNFIVKKFMLDFDMDLNLIGLSLSKKETIQAYLKFNVFFFGNVRKGVMLSYTLYNNILMRFYLEQNFLLLAESKDNVVFLELKYCLQYFLQYVVDFCVKNFFLSVLDLFLSTVLDYFCFLVKKIFWQEDFLKLKADILLLTIVEQGQLKFKIKDFFFKQLFFFIHSLSLVIQDFEKYTYFIKKYFLVLAMNPLEVSSSILFVKNVFSDFLENMQDVLAMKNIYRSVVFSTTRKAFNLIKTSSLREYVSTMQTFYLKKDIWYPDLGEETFLNWLVGNKKIINSTEQVDILKDFNFYKKLIFKDVEKIISSLNLEQLDKKHKSFFNISNSPLIIHNRKYLKKSADARLEKKMARDDNRIDYNSRLYWYPPVSESYSINTLQTSRRSHFLNKNIEAYDDLSSIIVDNYLRSFASLEDSLNTNNDISVDIENQNVNDDIDKDLTFDDDFATLTDDNLLLSDDIMDSVFLEDYGSSVIGSKSDVLNQEYSADSDLYAKDSFQSLWFNGYSLSPFPETRGTFFPKFFRFYSLFTLLRSSAYHNRVFINKAFRKRTRFDIYFKDDRNLYLNTAPVSSTKYKKLKVLEKPEELTVFDHYDSLLIDDSFDDSFDEFADDFSPIYDSDVYFNDFFSGDPNVIGQASYDFFFEKISTMPRNLSLQLFEYRNEIDFKIIYVKRKRFRILLRFYHFYDLGSEDKEIFFSNYTTFLLEDKRVSLIRFILIKFIGLNFSPYMLSFVSERVNFFFIKESLFFNKDRVFFEKMFLAYGLDPGLYFNFLSKHPYFKFLNPVEFFTKVERVLYYYELFRIELSLFSCVVLDTEVEWFRASFFKISVDTDLLWYKILCIKDELVVEEKVFFFRKQAIYLFVGRQGYQQELGFFLESIIKEYEMHKAVPYLGVAWYKHKKFISSVFTFIIFIAILYFFFAGSASWLIAPDADLTAFLEHYDIDMHTQEDREPDYDMTVRAISVNSDSHFLSRISNKE